VCLTVENVSDVSVDNWAEEVSKPDILTVVYFWHNQCPWCLRLNQIFTQIAEEFGGKMKFLKFNVLESPANQELAGNFGVMSTPTLLFLCKGRTVGQIVGFASKEDLQRGLVDILGRYRQCLSQSTELRPAYVV
jgi:thioredoxin 1